MGEPKIGRTAMARSQDVFQLLQDAQSQDATQPAAVQGKNALGFAVAATSPACVSHPLRILHYLSLRRRPKSLEVSASTIYIRPLPREERDLVWHLYQ
jgi:hypothetical protein